MRLMCSKESTVIITGMLMSVYQKPLQWKDDMDIMEMKMG
jgi:hypothetical protein